MRLQSDEEPDRDLYQLLKDDDLPHRVPRAMAVPALALVGMSLVFTVIAGPLYAYTDRAAHDLRTPSVYVDSVLSGSRR